jgi:tetratricopeptide (TPR) repeat protein
MHAKKYNESQMQFETVLNDLTFEGQFKTYFNLGILSLRLNNQLKAINYFKQSLDESSTYCPSNYQLGNIYFKMGQFEKALKNYKAASKGTCYDSPGPHYKQAISYMELRKYDFAQEKLNEVIERFSNQASYQALANKKLKEVRKLKNLESRFEDESIIQDGNILTPDF